MGTACHRTGERMMAALGQLNGAATLFENNKDVKFGGVLLALPALLSNGLLRFKKNISRLTNIFIQMFTSFYYLLIWH